MGYGWWSLKHAPWISITSSRNPTYTLNSTTGELAFCCLATNSDKRIIYTVHVAMRGVVVSGGWSNGFGWQQNTKNSCSPRHWGHWIMHQVSTVSGTTITTCICQAKHIRNYTQCTVLYCMTSLKYFPYMKLCSVTVYAKWAEVWVTPECNAHIASTVLYCMVVLVGASVRGWNASNAYCG